MVASRWTDVGEGLRVHGESEDPFLVEFVDHGGERPVEDDRYVGDLEALVREEDGKWRLGCPRDAHENNVGLAQQSRLLPVVGLDRELDGLDAAEVVLVRLVEPAGHLGWPRAQEALETMEERCQEVHRLHALFRCDRLTLTPHVFLHKRRHDQGVGSSRAFHQLQELFAGLDLREHLQVDEVPRELFESRADHLFCGDTGAIRQDVDGTGVLNHGRLLFAARIPAGGDAPSPPL